jgi:hypothetical protein
MIEEAQENIKMKFDLVITNPPYQNSQHTEKKNTLWRDFLALGIEELVNDEGHLSLVIPSSWMGSNQLLKKYFLPYNLESVNKDECRRHFPGVGSTFSYFIMGKKPYQGKTEIINKEINGQITVGNYDINSCVVDAFPRNISSVSVSIVNKVLHQNHERLGIVNNTKHHSVHKDRWRNEKKDNFIYPVQNTPSKLYWFNTRHIDQGKGKVLIPTTTYFRRMSLSTYGVTQSFCYYLIPEDVEATTALHNINNIVFDYINECFRYANWNSVRLLRKLPKIPMTHKLSEREIYDFFDLNSDEVEEIKKTITWR